MDRLIYLICDIRRQFAGYGYRRVTKELRRCGHLINHKRVARAMRVACDPRMPDLVGRRHHLHSHRCRLLLLAAIIDACSRKVEALLGLTVAERMKALMHLAHVLMRAAGLIAEKNDDEC